MNEDIKCYQCGYCCYKFRVKIIKPEYIDIVKNETDSGKIEEHMMEIKPPYQDCPHIKWVSHNEAICTIHEFPVFQLTTCNWFDLSFNNDDYCLVGRYIRKHNSDTKSEANYDGVHC